MGRATHEPEDPRRTFAYVRSADQDAAVAARHAVVVAGCGPVGLTAAIDLAKRGVDVVLLDDDDRLSTGSRAICFAKRTLEIFDRLGCGQRMVDKGVTWNVGKVFFRDSPVYGFDLLPEPGHQRPAFINIQQYFVEEYLLDQARTCPTIDLRWRNRVAGVTDTGDGLELEVDTPDGPYRLACDWLIAADGARSTIRGLLGQRSVGQTFRDRFLIADVRMHAALPTERWFWFDPPFHPGYSVLLHRQPDDVWRIDFQLGWDADPDLERTPERVIPRVRALLGPDVAFDLEWVSVYTFSCARMDRFRHGRVLFAGDSAHTVSPFGARGANSGIQDADNLGWKLALVVEGASPDRLLDSYDCERVAAADENILNSTRSTDFITPKSDASRAFRDATLELARDCAFARRLVNSGRLSVPATYAASPLSTPDADAFTGGLPPGAPAVDAPVRLAESNGWLLDALRGRFTVLCFVAGPESADPDELRSIGRLTAGDLTADLVLIAPAGDAGPTIPGATTLHDVQGHVAARYDGAPGTVYLLRPDQHVCGRWRRPDAAAVAAALRRATCQDAPPC